VAVAPPSLKFSLLEMPRAMSEMTLMLAGGRVVQEAPRGNGRPVLVVPGYMADDVAMSPLRWFLNRIGYTALPWKLGRNVESAGMRLERIADAAAFRHGMEQRLLQRVDEIVERRGEPISIVGWSMGGMYANTVALQRPDNVRQVITLGTLFGDPRGTFMWNMLRLTHRHRVKEHEQDLSSWLRHDDYTERRVPTTVIYSTSDGVVAPASAMLAEHPLVEHIAVPSSHLGFAYNPLVWKAIAEALYKHRPASD
jgi:pimeloyl-ACP methyl ester carboxylesterase